MAQHPLGVVAGRLRLDHRRRPGRVEPGEQHRRFDLRRRHRQPIVDRDRVAGAGDGERQAAAFARDEARAEAAQRLDDAAHRPPPQRGVAGDEGGDRVGREDAEKEPRRGAGIAQIEQVFGLGEPADRRRRRPSTGRRRPETASAPSAFSAAAVASTSSPSSRPVISVRPTASAPSISARCEIDLSPGTRILPASGAAGRAAVSGAGDGASGSWAIGQGSVSGNAVAVASPSAHMPVLGGAMP